MSLELHSVDSANFECSQTPSLASSLKTKFPRKFAESHESQTENPSVVLNVESKNNPSLRGRIVDSHKASVRSTDPHLQIQKKQKGAKNDKNI